MEKTFKYIKGSYSNMSYEERQEIITYIMNNKLGYNISDDTDIINFITDMLHHIDNICNTYFHKFYSLFIRQYGFDMCLIDIEGNNIDDIEDVKISTSKEDIILLVENYYDSEQIDEFILPIKYINDEIIHFSMINKLKAEYEYSIKQINDAYTDYLVMKQKMGIFKKEFDIIDYKFKHKNE